MTSPISEPLRAAIIASRLSHAAIEHATGVDRASIARFVARERSLRLDVADRLANYLRLVLSKGENMTALANPNVFVFSAASEVARMHYEHTMQNGLKLAQIIGFIDDPSLVYTLRDAYSEGVVYMWAGRTGGHDEGYWEQMAPGDLVLCYRDRRIVSYSYFVAKLKNASLGKLAWPDERIRPFDLIFFLTNPKEVDKPVSELSDYLGEVYQGLRRVAATDKIIRDFGSLEAFVAKGLK